MQQQLSMLHRCELCRKAWPLLGTPEYVSTGETSLLWNMLLCFQIICAVEDMNRKYNWLFILPLTRSGSGDKIILGIYRMHIFTRHFRSVSVVCPVNPGSHIRFLFKDRVRCGAFFFPLSQGWLCQVYVPTIHRKLFQGGDPEEQQTLFLVAHALFSWCLYSWVHFFCKGFLEGSHQSQHPYTEDWCMCWWIKPAGILIETLIRSSTKSWMSF